MRNLFIGCGAVVLLALAVCCGGVAWLSYQGYREYSVHARGIEDLAALEEQFPFDPPADNVIDPARLDVYLDVREAYHRALVENTVFTRDLLRSEYLRNGDIGFRSVMSEYMTVGAGRARYIAGPLAEHGMSASEWRHLARVSHATLGQALNEESELTPLARELMAGAEYTEEFLERNYMDEFYDVTLEGGVFHFDRAFRGVRDTVRPLPAGNRETLLSRADRLRELPRMTYFEMLLLAELDETEHQWRAGRE